jgi:hypothetical protein
MCIIGWFFSSLAASALSPNARCYNPSKLPSRCALIDPVIFTIGNFSLRWYGVIVMTGVIVGSLIVEQTLKRYGENPDNIWDALVWWVSFGPTIKTPIGNFRLGLPLGVLPIGRQHPLSGRPLADL